MDKVVKSFFANQFIYNSTLKVFSGEASDLGIEVGKTPTCISITGRKDTVVYKMYEVLTDNEGWIYWPDGTTVPGANGTKVVIFND